MWWSFLKDRREAGEGLYVPRQKTDGEERTYLSPEKSGTKQNQRQTTDIGFVKYKKNKKMDSGETENKEESSKEEDRGKTVEMYLNIYSSPRDG